MQNETNPNPQVEMEISSPVGTDTPQATDAPVHPSNCLAAAREAKRLSVGDAAYALKIGSKVIQSIEASDWQALPGRTFTVGILRAYGRLLNVSVDALIDEVPGSTPAVKKNHIQPSSSSLKAPPATRRDGENKRQEKRMLKLGAIMVVLAIVLAYAMPAAFWDESIQSAQGLINRWVRQDIVQPPAAEPAASPAGAEAPKGEPAPEAVAQTSPGTLELKFSAPAWVEVRDYTGRIIYSQLNAAGSTQFITGAAPLDVLIGNARQVQARWRDEPVKLDKLTGDDVSRQVLR